jgi:hypothetical protein
MPKKSFGGFVQDPLILNKTNPIFNQWPDKCGRLDWTIF